MTPLLIITIIFLVIGILFLISVHNTLIRRKNAVDNAFAGIDTQLKKRYDLIPNLVATVKEFASHEKELLTGITALRSNVAWDDMSMNDKLARDQEAAQKIKGLMVAVEAYPELKSHTNFLMLQRNLNEIESQLSAARRTFNATVTHYNDSIQVFPQNLVAGWMKLEPKRVYEAPQDERGNVNVGELFG